MENEGAAILHVVMKDRKERITMSNMTNPNETLRGLSEGNLSVLDTLRHMTEGTLEESGLDPETFMLVRIAALTTLDAAPAAWLLNLKISGAAGVAPERIIGTLIAIAPVVGTARIVSAAGGIVRAYGLDEALSERQGS
jgi:4-carboxymuconolactone decarboxylase